MTRWNLMLTVLVVVMLAGLAVVLSGCGSDSATGDPDVVGDYHAYPEALNPGVGDMDIILLPVGVKDAGSKDNLVLSDCYLYLYDDNDAEFEANLDEGNVGLHFDLEGTWEQDGNLVYVDLNGPAVVQTPDITATIELSFTGDNAAGGTMTFSIEGDDYEGTVVIVRDTDVNP
jgi:hypothetical protein